VPFDEAQARIAADAFQRYGKGAHLQSDALREAGCEKIFEEIPLSARRPASRPRRGLNGGQ